MFAQRPKGGFYCCFFNPIRPPDLLCHVLPSERKWYRTDGNECFKKQTSKGAAIFIKDAGGSAARSPTVAELAVRSAGAIFHVSTTNFHAIQTEQGLITVLCGGDVRTAQYDREAPGRVVCDIICCYKQSGPRRCKLASTR